MKKLTQIVSSIIVSGLIFTGCESSIRYQGQYRDTPYKLSVDSSENYVRIIMQDTTRNNDMFHPAIVGVKLDGSWHEIKMSGVKSDDPLVEYAHPDSLDKMIMYRGEK
jgi:hypothetical protein